MAKLQETMSFKVLIIARAVKRKTNPERIRTARLGKKRFKNPKSYKYDKMTIVNNFTSNNFTSNNIPPSNAIINAPELAMGYR